MVFLLFLVGCLNNDEETQVPVDQQDHSWLEGIPCSVPCWFGLIPDQSTKNDVLSIIKNISFIDSESIVSRSSQFHDVTTDEYFPAIRILAQYKIQKGERGNVRFLVSGDKLRLIEATLNYEVSLGKLVQIFGRPDIIMAIEQPQISGDSYCSIRIFWVDKQLFVWYQDRDQVTWLKTCEQVSNGSQISSSQLIYTFSITNRDYGKQILKNENVLTWPGFLD